MIIDAETHPLTIEQDGRVGDSSSRLLKFMDRHGVDAAIILPGAQKSNVPGITIERSAKKDPKRLIPFCRYFYRSPVRAYEPPIPPGGWIDDRERALKEFHEMLRTGVFKGVGELAIVEMGSEQPAQSIRAYRPFFDILAKFKLPVQFHTGTGLGKPLTEVSPLRRLPMNFFNPLWIDDLASEYPEVPFIVAHCGSMLPPFSDVSLYMAAKNDNVYLGLSNLVLMANLEGMKVYKKFVRNALRSYGVGAERLIFATDWYPEYEDRGLCSAHFRAIGEVRMSTVDRELIMGDNMKRLLRL